MELFVVMRGIVCQHEADPRWHGAVEAPPRAWFHIHMAKGLLGRDSRTSYRCQSIQNGRPCSASPSTLPGGLPAVASNSIQLNRRALDS